MRKNKICREIADFAVISITNSFWDDRLIQFTVFTQNIIRQSLVS